MILESLTVKELKEIATRLHLNTTGNKAQLISAIRQKLEEDAIKTNREEKIHVETDFILPSHHHATHRPTQTVKR